MEALVIFLCCYTVAVTITISMLIGAYREKLIIRALDCWIALIVLGVIGLGFISLIINIKYHG